MTAPPVEVDRLVKHYGAVQALERLSFTALAGQVTAVLGPNGAGKTTAIEVCEGFRLPDGGSVRVLGLEPRERSLRARVGVMPQTGGSYQAAKVGEVLALFASFYAQPLSPRALLDRLEIGHLAGRMVKRLSGGEAQRLSLALALVGRPELVFLDEPTASLDVQSRYSTWELVRDLRRAGVSVVLTTHYIEEAEALADHVVIVDHGRTIASGSPSELVGEGQSVTFTGGAELARLAIPPGLVMSEPRPGSYLIEGTSTRTLDAVAVAEVTAALAAAGSPATNLRVGGPTLEDTFLRLTGRSIEVSP